MVATSRTTGRTTAPARTFEGKARLLTDRLKSLIGPGGSISRLAQSNPLLADRLGAFSLPIRQGYSPTDALSLNRATGEFMNGEQVLTEAQAISLLAEALATGATSSEAIEQRLSYQTRFVVESSRQAFSHRRAQFVGTVNVLRGLNGKPPLATPTRDVTAFGGDDALRAARLFEGLNRVSVAKQAEVSGALAGIAQPTDVDSQVAFLTRAGYDPHVSRQLVDEAPHLADAIVKAARTGLRLPTEAKEGWGYFYPGELAFEPVTLWRGVDAQRFNPRHKFEFKAQAGREFSFLSPDVRMPFMRSIWSYTGGTATPERTHGVLVKYQVPRLLVMKTENGHPALVQKMVPDHAPLVSAIGKVAFNAGAEQVSDNASMKDVARLVTFEAPNPTVMKERDPGQPGAPLEVLDPLSWAVHT